MPGARRGCSVDGTAALIALGDNDPHLEDEYRTLGTTAGAYDDWHEGRDPAGITTQDPALSARLDPIVSARKLANYLSVITLEAHDRTGLRQELMCTISSQRIWRR